MKIRNGFVSNSSSSSFLLMVNSTLYKKITDKKSFPRESKENLDKLLSSHNSVNNTLFAYEFDGDMNDYYCDYDEHIEVLSKELKKLDPSRSKWFLAVSQG